MQARVILASAALLLLCAIAGAVAWQLSGPAAAPAQTAAPKPVASSVSAPPSSLASTTSTRSATAPSASERPAPKPPQTPPRCFASLLPDAAFGPGPPPSELSACCRDRRAYGGTLRLKSALVAAGGPTNVTEAMREWSKLGWYEIAAYGLLRSQCCPDAPALTAPKLIAACKLEAALAVIANSMDDAAQMDRAAKAFHRAARCIALSGAAEIFGRFDPPYGGERKYFDRIAERVRKARAR